ncbi:T9SS type A sorting domain-containing protein [Bacteroidales bacterium AH-315-I05]|nr:T9SS type A sorting domain-containing protein [Bacteroidales bacterium AH-315-I05]
MKYIISILLIAGCCFCARAQKNTEKCAAMQAIEARKKQQPKIAENIWKAELKARKWLEENNKRSATDFATIPVVVHIVYNENDSLQNVHDSLVYSQIEVLNEDFRRTNPDAINTRQIFDTIAADTQIDFCLADTDPDGNPITGITRTSTSETTFDPLSAGFDKVKFDSTGGKSAWPADSYFNIWVCNMNGFFGPGVLGYAQFPGDAPETDGVVIHYEVFGKNYNDILGNTVLGRTAAHEAGHWLGLRHIWGDEGNPIFGTPGNCDSTDYVHDTPMANQASNYQCDLNRNSCANESFESNFWGTTDPPDMVENYMDYSADDCMNLFTKGQSDRMWSFLNTDRVSLLNSNGCSGQTTVAENSFLKNNIRIYPNPSSQKVFIETEEPIIHVELFNELGQTLKQISVLDEGKISVDIVDVPTGLYFLKIYSEDEIVVKKLLKQ